MQLETLAVEVTRRCNLKCGHCLRGGVQRKDLAPTLFGRLLRSDIDYIETLIITGGEPSLVPHVIKGLMLEILTNGAGFGHFYIATNGMNITDEFIEVVERFAEYAQLPGLSSIEVSRDFYHINEDPQGKAELGLLKLQEALSPRIFVTDRDRGSSHTRGVVGQGRARTNQISYDPPTDGRIVVGNEYIEGTLHLNCEGWVIDGCDWSYADQKRHRLFHVEQAFDILDVLPGGMEEAA